MAFRVSYTSTRVTVNSLHLFSPGGDVFDWCKAVGTEWKAHAWNLCPPGTTTSKRGGYATGALRKSISMRTLRVGGHEIDVTLEAKAPYAMFVHEGTAYQGQRWIYSRPGYARKAEIDLVMRRRLGATGGEFGGVENRGLFMPLPHDRSKSRRDFHLRVKGQRANPFLTDAYTVLRGRHSALPRKSFKYSNL